MCINSNEAGSSRSVWLVSPSSVMTLGRMDSLPCSMSICGCEGDRGDADGDIGCMGAVFLRFSKDSWESCFNTESFDITERGESVVVGVPEG